MQLARALASTLFLALPAASGTLRAGADVDPGAPVLRDCKISPRALLSAGGRVQLLVTATDDTGLSLVSAAVRNPDGSVSPLLLAPVGPETFLGSVTLPPNQTARTLRYDISFRATDIEGKATELPCGSVTVHGAGAPEGRLRVSPARLRFGRVRVGRAVRRRLTLRNVGPGRLFGQIEASGPPFAVGIPGDGAFTLPPRKRLSVLVTFTPQNRGRFTDPLTIVSDDPQHPELDVEVTGTGAGRRPG
jgi:hypothetical protein